MRNFILLLAAALLTACGGGGGGSSAEAPAQIAVKGAGFYDGETIVEITVRDDGGYGVAGMRVNLVDLSGKVSPARYDGYTSASGRLYIPMTAAVPGWDNGSFEITAGGLVSVAEYIINEDGAAPPTYRVYFERNGGNYVSTVQVHYAALITEPPTPIRQGYVFQGWYADEQFITKWDFTAERVYGIMRLYAKWGPQN